MLSCVRVGLERAPVQRRLRHAANQLAPAQFEAIRYQELTPMLLNEVQKQARALRRKDAEIASLATRLSAIEERTQSGISADVPTGPTSR